MHQPTTNPQDISGLQILRVLIERCSDTAFAEELAQLLAKPSSDSNEAVPFLQRLVDARVLDRIAARAAFLMAAGRLDPRDLREVLPLWHLQGRNSNAVMPTRHSERPPALEAGQVVGRSVIEAILCSNPHSDVYRGRHSGLGCAVVVKIAGRGQPADQLRVEVAVLSEVNHRNVVRLWDAGTIDGFPFLITHYYAQGSLKDELGHREHIRSDRVVGLIRDVARGLRATLAHGYVHGDVKPGNLLLDSDGTVVIADLGTARRVDLRGSVMSDSIDGSWPYLAPERFSGYSDHRADIYSLGLTVYHVLTGYQPVVARTHRECLRAHRELSLEPLHWSIPGVSRELSKLLLKMVARDSANRPASYDEIIAQLSPVTSPNANYSASDCEGSPL